MSSTAGIGAEIENMHDRHRVGVLLLDHRRVGRFRQVADDGIDLGAHFLRGDVGVLRQVEGDGDARDCPSVEVERSSSMPATVFTAASMRSVISFSMLSGVAPGLVVVTDTTGVSMRGIAVDPQLRKR